MKKLVLISLVSLSLFSQVALATQTIQAKVNGMVCAFCAQGIEKKCVVYRKPKMSTSI